MRLAAVALVAAVSCSSAGLPGAQEPLEQIGRAERVTLELDLTNASRAEEAYFAQNDTYTTDVTALGVNSSEGVTLTIPTADTTTYCVEVTDGENTMHLSKESPSPAAGPC
ncbi:MAG: hypothetical protein ACRDKT_00595 [Actinomycetota bacterium]